MLFENKEVSDSFEVANIFNDYFIKVGSNLAKQIISDINQLSYVNHNHHNLFIPNIEEIEIKKHYINPKKHSSWAWHDDLSGSIMKNFEEFYITPLTYIINLSISQGHFPDELKLAKVIPIYKSGDKQSIENYRPISVLSFFSKKIRKIVANYVLIFLDQHAILYDHQFGFRRGHSTSHAIISLVEKVSRSLDTGKIVVGVFLDLKKAFDTVDHQNLLDKLYAHGLRNNIYEWFKSYLANRSQYVMYNNSKSETKHITHGVPQGSILGPLLFILYINDFSRASDLLFSILFADDTSVFIEGQSYTGVIETLNKELKNIVSWLNSNKLTLNVKKTHYMIFHRSRIKNNIVQPNHF